MESTGLPSSPDAEARPDYTTMSRHERIVLIESVYIEYPKTTAILKAIERCHQGSKTSAEPDCLFLEGQTGLGKSTLIDQYASKHPPYRTEDGLYMPILIANVPAPTTVKFVAQELLFAIGDPAYDRGSSKSMELRLRTFIKECGVELIVLDEFQHLIDSESARVLTTVANWIKLLIKNTKKPIICCGLPDSGEVLQDNSQSQLNSIFCNRQLLTPFGWNTEDQKNELRAFLKTLSNEIPLQQPPILHTREMAYRFWCATAGELRKIMKIVRRGVKLALEEQCEDLTPQHLGRAFNDIDKVSNNKNPFLIGQENLTGPPEMCTEVTAEGTPAKRRGSSKRVSAKDRKETGGSAIRGN